MTEPTDRQPPSLPLQTAAPQLSVPTSRPLARPAAPGYHKASLRPLSGTTPTSTPLELSSGLQQLDFPTHEQLYLRALDAAIELLHADGGVLATLEPTGQRLVVRCRRESGLLAAQYSALAALGQPSARSRPLRKAVDESSAVELQQTQPLAFSRRASGTQEAAEASSAEAPAAQAAASESARAVPGGYAKGYGLPGYIWQVNQALALSGEKCKEVPRDENTPADQQAPWYLAAPIRAPQMLLPLGSDSLPRRWGNCALHSG
jgi:hypothetical protein